MGKVGKTMSACKSRTIASLRICLTNTRWRLHILRFQVVLHCVCVSTLEVDMKFCVCDCFDKFRNLVC